MIWPSVAIGCVFGAIIGSFLNVVIARLPRGESLIRPGSRCPACAADIRWYDNVPILSYLWLGARCRACRAPISFRYPVVEGLTCGLFGAAVYKFGLSIDLAAALVLVSALVAITYIDLDHRIIPNEISFPGIPIGFAFGSFRASVGPVDAAAGILLGGLGLFLVATLYERIRGREGMGMGDVKLLAMVGAFLGWKGVVVTVLIASLVGSVVGLGEMIRSRGTLQLAIPFGPFLALGAMAYLYSGEEMLAWYLGAYRE
jgi:leader peptidase (prepilin peptidase)/N-methyltransferase